MWTIPRASAPALFVLPRATRPGVLWRQWRDWTGLHLPFLCFVLEVTPHKVSLKSPLKLISKLAVRSKIQRRTQINLLQWTIPGEEPLLRQGPAGLLPLRSYSLVAALCSRDLWKRLSAIPPTVVLLLTANEADVAHRRIQFMQIFHPETLHALAPHAKGTEEAPSLNSPSGKL